MTEIKDSPAQGRLEKDMQSLMNVLVNTTARVAALEQLVIHLFRHEQPEQKEVIKASLLKQADAARDSTNVLIRETASVFPDIVAKLK